MNILNKILFGSALFIGFGAYGTIAVLDYLRVEKEIKSIMSDRDISEWAQEVKADIIIWGSSDTIYNAPCAYYSAQADCTQLFIDWVMKKYSISKNK